MFTTLAPFLAKDERGKRKKKPRAKRQIEAGGIVMEKEPKDVKNVSRERRTNERTNVRTKERKEENARVFSRIFPTVFSFTSFDTNVRFTCTYVSTYFLES